MTVGSKCWRGGVSFHDEHAWAAWLAETSLIAPRSVLPGWKHVGKEEPAVLGPPARWHGGGKTNMTPPSKVRFGVQVSPGDEGASFRNN